MPDPRPRVATDDRPAASSRRRSARGKLVRQLVLVVACSPWASALAQSLELSQYAHTSWRMRDLHPGGSILSIAQTPDGYLWLGTDAGLFRFDGVRAVPWQPPDGQQLPKNFEYVTRLRASSDGALWIGTLGGLARWRDGKVTIYREFTGKLVTAIFEDSNRVIWLGVGSPARLCAIRDAAISCQESERFGVYVTDIFTDRRGDFWVVSHTGVWRWAPGSPKYHPISQHPSLTFAVEDGDGAIVASSTRELKRLERDTFEPYQLPGISGQFSATKLFRSRDGSLWVAGSDLGLYHVHRERTDRFSTADGLTSDRVSTFFEDREGNVWVGTANGLDKFHPVPAPRLSSKLGLSSATVWSVQAAPDGSVWMGTPAGLNRWQDGRVTVFAGEAPNGEGVTSALRRVPSSDARSMVYSLGLDSRGHLWASTMHGLVRSTKGHFVPIRNTYPGPASAIVGDARGAVWISYVGIGLYHYSPAGTVRRVQEAQADGLNSMSALAHDGQNGLWAGLLRVGVAHLVDGQVRARYGPTDGLGSLFAYDLRMGSDSAVWVATSGGLSRVKDGHVTTLSAKHGLPCDAVHWSIEDDDRSLWMRTSCGLLRVPRGDVDAWVRDTTRRVVATMVGGQDGVTGDKIPFPHRPAVTKANDGRIWFVDAQGARVIDPRRVPFNELPPPVHVEEVTADGTTYGAISPSRSPVRLPPRVRNLEIRYTALSLTAPEKVKFRFMLEGQDTTWREALNQRRVEYSNLPPGTYRFRITAANNEGVWNTAGASLDLTIAPAWNQTWWFFALVATAIAAAAAGAAMTWQHRRSRLATERAQARFDAMLAERTRVARELHDTLLGDMAGVAMQLNAGARRLETLGRAESGVGELLSGLSTQVQRTLVEARRSVTAMRAAPGESRPLHDQLADAAERTFADASITTSVEHVGAPRPYPPTVEAEVLGIATEAMTNARNHAGCRTMTVTCSYAPRALQVRVRDDGRGFDASQASPAGHWGLVGMRERAASIGATLSVSSSPGAGTEVVLVLPGGPGRWTWWNKSIAPKQF